MSKSAGKKPREKSDKQLQMFVIKLSNYIKRKNKLN